MGIFDEKKDLTRPELKHVFRKDSGAIPHTAGRRYIDRQREKLSQEPFPQRKYGSKIDPKEYKHAVKSLERTMREAPMIKDKVEIRRKVDYLKRMGGMK